MFSVLPRLRVEGSIGPYKKREGRPKPPLGIEVGEGGPPLEGSNFVVELNSVAKVRHFFKLPNFFAEIFALSAKKMQKRHIVTLFCGDMGFFH